MLQFRFISFSKVKSLDFIRLRPCDLIPVVYNTGHAWAEKNSLDKDATRLKPLPIQPADFEALEKIWQFRNFIEKQEEPVRSSALRILALKCQGVPVSGRKPHIYRYQYCLNRFKVLWESRKEAKDGG